MSTIELVTSSSINGLAETVVKRSKLCEELVKESVDGAVGGVK